MICVVNTNHVIPVCTHVCNNVYVYVCDNVRIYVINVAVCTVEEEVGRTWTIQMPGSTIIGKNQVLPGSTVIFDCSVGKLMGQKQLKCLDDGNFDGKYPECTGKYLYQSILSHTIFCFSDKR